MKKAKESLRSRQWFNDPEMPGMTALYLERYLNYGLTRAELQSDRPIIGIAQTGSDLTPCNRHHLELATRIKEGIRDAGGVPLEFPVHPIQETGRRPTAALDRNLQCLSLIEILHGYPLDGVVLTTGCDKTTAALIMGAASVNLPAIALSVGPMLNGSYLGNCTGSGEVIWDARKKLANGEIDRDAFMELVISSAPSAGHCNTMGTALTMNCLVEALGMSMPGSASIPAPYRARQQVAYESGKRVVDMVWEQLTPSRILVREAFENAIVVCAAIGGSTNAPIHINALARHANVPLTMEDWQAVGQHIPQLVNCRPVGEYLAEEFHRAGGLTAVINVLHKSELLHPQTLTVTGKTIIDNCRGREIIDERVIKDVSRPVKKKAGFLVLSGNLFESALMKVSAISQAFHDRFLSDPDNPGVFEGKVVVFDGPEDYHDRIDDPSLNINEHSILVMRGAGPVAYPGSAEVVNMQPPARLIKQGVMALPTIGDGRQSGTSAAPSILNASPEAAVGGNLSILKDGDKIRIDLNTRRVDVLITDSEITERHKNLQFNIPKNQTWWQQIYRQQVSSLSTGAVFNDMLTYNNIAKNIPRHSH